MSAKELREREKFWNKVDLSEPDACWEWVGYVGSDGYGSFYWSGRTHHAHRVCWMLLKGPIPDGLVVMHMCDNRLCVKPGHLALGTQKDNMDDAAMKYQEDKRRDAVMREKRKAAFLGGLTNYTRGKP